MRWSLLLALLCLILSQTWAFRLPFSGLAKSRVTDDSKVERYDERKGLYMSSTDGLDDSTRKRLDTVIKNNKVVLFMKGSKLFPQCGFSNTAVRILDAINTPFEAVNVLDDDKVRQGIKVYSSWPTIPQLYVNGEFVGGSDIMIQLYNSGELAEMIEVANAN